MTAAMGQAKRIGLHAVPVIAWCERVSVPVVVGIIKPMILVPSGLLTGLNESQLKAILAHEFAHIRRLDPLVNVMQRVIESALFFHPAVWYASHVVSREREICCDDMVLRAGNSGVVMRTHWSVWPKCPPSKNRRSLGSLPMATATVNLSAVSCDCSLANQPCEPAVDSLRCCC